MFAPFHCRVFQVLEHFHPPHAAEKVSLFVSLNEEQLQTVAGIMTERWEKDGVYLCHEGDKSDEMYIIVQGQVAIIKEATGKAGQVIYVAKAGEAIGELQVLSTGARTAAMQARGDIHLLVIEGAHSVGQSWANCREFVVACPARQPSAAGIGRALRSTSV